MHHIPNILTLLRIALAIAFPFVSASYHQYVIITALSSEFLDGFLSRQFNWRSRLGSYLDPIADKLFFASVGLCWVSWRIISWHHLALLASREIGLLVGFLFLMVTGHHRKIKFVSPTFFGKLTTVLQYVNIFFILWVGSANASLIWIAGICGALAALQYFSRLTNGNSLASSGSQ